MYSLSQENIFPRELNNTKWIVVALSMITFLVTVDMMSVNLALPAIARNFSASLSELQWVITGFTFVSGIFAVTCGKLGDQYGIRNVFLIGIAIFAISSILIACTTTSNALIITRAIQGLGYAFITALSNIIITTYISENRTGTVLGIVSGVSALAATLGPVLIGVILYFSNWRMVFLLNVPFCIISFFIVFMICPENKVKKNQKFDFFGFVLTSSFLFCLLLVLSNISTWGVFSKPFILLSVLASSLFYLYTRHEKAVKEPVISFSILKNKVFLAMNMIRFIVSFVSFSLLFLVVLFLENIDGYNALYSGLIFLDVSAAMVVSAVISGPLIDKKGGYNPLFMSILTLVITFMIITFNPESKGLIQYVLYFFIGLALGIIKPAISYVILKILPENQQGSANGISVTTLPVGGMFGVAVSAWVLAKFSSYESSKELALNHMTLSQEQMQHLTEAGNGTISLASLKSYFPDDQINQMILIAKQSFVHGYNAAMAMSTLLFLVAFGLAIYAYKRSVVKESLQV